MRISIQMQSILDELSRIEPKQLARLSGLSVSDLANGLIHLYYKRDCLHTRELIREYLSQAGPSWLHKLMTRDTGPVASQKNKFAGLKDYLGVLAANDESSELISNG